MCVRCPDIAGDSNALQRHFCAFGGGDFCDVPIKPYNAAC
jgi:hypothetical protein